MYRIALGSISCVRIRVVAVIYGVLIIFMHIHTNVPTIALNAINWN